MGVDARRPMGQETTKVPKHEQEQVQTPAPAEVAKDAPAPAKVARAPAEVK